MTDVRQRKGQKKQAAKAASVNGVQQRNNTPRETAPSPGLISFNDVKKIASFLWSLLGILFLFFSAYFTSWYTETLHENQLWFSAIPEVGREISLRTECGLYYSYYKQLVLSPTFTKGLNDLTHDNATEHGRTINIIERFNIYQEIFLAWIYRTLQPEKEHILFYVSALFRLTGFYVFALFACAWYLTGTWLAGLLAAVLFSLNIHDTTRVFFSLNLRENFALPFFAAQLVCISVYLSRRKGVNASFTSTLSSFLAQLGTFIFTFLFAITWQFNQFILLLQAFSLYALFVLQLAPLNKLRRLLKIQLTALLTVCALQYFHPMIPGSLIVSFIAAASLMMWWQSDWTLTGGILDGAIKVAFQAISVLATMFAANYILRTYVLHLSADEHIFKFVRAKFGFGSPLDFDARIYLCHGAFAVLDSSFFTRTSYGLLFPLYFAFLLGALFAIGRALLLEWCAPILESQKKIAQEDPTDKLAFFNRRPALAFITVESFFAGVVAITTLRMKYFWTLHMCALAPVLAADYEVWDSLLAFRLRRRKLVINTLRFTLTTLLILLASYQLGGRVRTEMDDLREFYDPDTVELMYWIGNNTLPDSSFGGSMQLLAGVKCCTGRHLMNHPHFEDKWLRERTREIYQMYARKTPEDVYKILKRIGTDYIILEDSICLAPSDNCRTPDLMDLDNGHIPDNGWTAPGLVLSSTPRFCDQIRYGEGAYTKFFKIVLHNRTFRVYQLL